MKRLILLLILVLTGLNIEAVKGSKKARRSVVRTKTVDPISSTVIAMDLDDVMSIKQKPSALDFIKIVRAIFWNPRVLGALTKIGELQQEGSQVGQTTNGTSNVVHIMLERLKDRGYGDFSYYEDEIIAASTKPKPIMPMVQKVRALKKKGYILVGATNQDWKQHAAYRKKMKEQGVDLNELFDAVVTTAVNHSNPSQAAQENGFYCPVINENIYASTTQGMHKPDAGYYELVRDVATYIGRTKKVYVKRTVFTDDNKENTDGAIQARIEAIHFDLPGGSARKTSPEDLQKTVDQWHARLHELSVDIE